LEFAAEPLHIEENGEQREKLSLRSSWCGKDGKPGSVRFVPEAVVLPLYHKIRIAFPPVFKQVLQCDSVIEQLRSIFPSLLDERLEWDVFLATGTAFKEDIRRSVLAQNDRCALLERPLPRFMWRAIGLKDEAPAIEFLFDATDIEQGDYRIGMVVYDPALQQHLGTVTLDT
ncbi:MAG: hypothetical protein IID05_11945, partial [Gemmatimonadetes bacterium]|nr:hypothetical protein [Gemmatimonadota bacterium]